MINKETLNRIKNATVAIGLVDTQDRPIGFLGSGFIANNKGYVVTADHVMNGCEIQKEILLKQLNKKAEIAAFFVVSRDNEIRLNIIHELKSFAIKVSEGTDSYQGPLDLDVAVIIPKEEIDSKEITFLEIKQQPYDWNLLEEICMCGYPNPSYSLNLYKEWGLRLSPCMQFGRVTSLFPEDHIKIPWGLQSDIVGTGGSSGSPILDFKGKVIGIAQNVLPAEVSGETHKVNLGIATINELPLSGSAKIGLVYGVTFSLFSNLPDIAFQNHKEGKIESQSPLKITAVKHVYTTRIVSKPH